MINNMLKIKKQGANTLENSTVNSPTGDKLFDIWL